MLWEYHKIITQNAIGKFFGDEAMREIIAANFKQDALANLLGKPEIHFDNDKVAESLAYIDAELARMANATGDDTETQTTQWDAFGRLCHTAQDFYAHSNYVDLWLAENGGLENTLHADIDGLDEKLLTHLDLRTGSFHLLRDIVYYIPLIQTLARKIYIPKFSHETMHLDDPSRGAKFDYAIQAATQRTRYEYQRAIDALSTRGSNASAVRLFHQR